MHVAERNAPVTDTQAHVERRDIADFAGFGQRVRHDVDIHDDVVARDATNSDPALRSRSLRRSRKIASHRRHDALGRGEPDPVAVRIETTAQNLYIVTPPPLVTALHFHRESFVLFHTRAFHFRTKIVQAEGRTKFIWVLPRRSLSERRLVLRKVRKPSENLIYSGFAGAQPAGAGLASRNACRTHRKAGLRSRRFAPARFLQSVHDETQRP